MLQRICEKCFKIIRSKKSNFKRHMQLHEAKNLQTRLKCNVCQKTYQNVGNFKKHVENHHSSHNGMVTFTYTGEGTPRMPYFLWLLRKFSAQKEKNGNSLKGYQEINWWPWMQILQYFIHSKFYIFFVNSFIIEKVFFLLKWNYDRQINS